MFRPMFRPVLHYLRLASPLRRSLCAQRVPLYPSKISVGGVLGSGVLQPASTIQQLVAEIAAIKGEIEDLERSVGVVMRLAEQVKENEEICSLFCAEQIVCEAERDFRFLFIRSQCGDGSGDKKYIYVNNSGEIKSTALDPPDFHLAVIKEITIRMPPTQLEPPIELHLYLSNGYLLMCSRDADATNTIATIRGIESVVDRLTWFLRDPITMGTSETFLRPFSSQQLVVRCSADTPLELENENMQPTPEPNLIFQAIMN